MSLDIYLIANIDVGNSDKCYVYIGDTDLNCTHNLAPMWRLAGCFSALYESSGKMTRDVLPILRKSVEEMEDNPSKYKKLNHKSGWGNYKIALEFLRKVIIEFSKYPKAIIKVSA